MAKAAWISIEAKNRKEHKNKFIVLCDTKKQLTYFKTTSNLEGKDVTILFQIILCTFNSRPSNISF